MTSRKFGTKVAPTHTRPSWPEVVEALDLGDPQTLRDTARRFGVSEPVKQHGLSLKERLDQIMKMAPGEHPLLPGLLLDLADFLEL